MFKKYVTIFSVILCSYVGLQASEQDELKEQLYDALQCCNEQEVTDCLKRGADVNAILDLCKTTTPLHEAVSFGTLNIVKILVQRGADKDKCFGHPSYTPAQLAITLCNNPHKLAFLKYLIEVGCDIDAANEDGHTAMHLAVSVPNFEVFKTVFEAGAGIHNKDEYGRMPLHWATQITFASEEKRKAAFASVVALLQIDNDTTYGDYKGHTAVRLDRPVKGNPAQEQMTALVLQSVAQSGMGSGV